MKWLWSLTVNITTKCKITYAPPDPWLAVLTRITWCVDLRVTIHLRIDDYNWSVILNVVASFSDRWIYWVTSRFGLVLSLSGTAQRNRSRSNYHGYLHVLRYLLFITIILKQKGVMQTYNLQTFKRDIFVELSWSDVCKPTRLHHSFLLW